MVIIILSDCQIRCWSSRVCTYRSKGSQEPNDIDLPGSNGLEQFVRLKLLWQEDEPALLSGSYVQTSLG